MLSLLLFILLGLLLSAPGEILNQILSRQNPGAFRSTMISYAILLFVGFFVRRGLTARIKDRARAMIVYYLLFGSLGLMVEWFLLGNSPVLDPFQVITQPGMFTFWGTMLLGPCLIMESRPFARLKRSFVIYFTSFSAAYLLIAFAIPRAKGGIFLGFVIFAAGTAALNYYYVKYFRLLRTALPVQNVQSVIIPRTS